jgi:hypothetical protein
MSIADALAIVLQIAGVAENITNYVSVILRITQKGETISQDELDELLAGINQRSAQIQNVQVPKE